MSFSQESKLEVLNSNIEIKDNLQAFVYGLYASSCEPMEDDFYCFLTDILDIFILIKKIFKKYFKNNENYSNLDNLVLLQEEYKIGNKINYKIKINKYLFNDFFVNYNLNSSIEENCSLNIMSAESIKSFCKGAFLNCATSSIKISTTPNVKTTSGYHLEFDSKSHEFLLTLSNYLAQFDITAKIIKRKNMFVLYIKDAEQVSDTLALVGANNSVLTLQNEIVNREFRNKINRQTNCESGNISKMVTASMKQLDAIEKIENTIGLSALSPDLEEVAILRLANPEESLTDLLKLSTLNLTKSGLNHRLRKLISIADNLT